MKIEVKDLLDDNATRVCLCNAIAEKLVENHFFETEDRYNDDGFCVGFDEVLAEDVEKQVRNVALKVAIEETEKMLQNNWDIKNKIRETIKDYIVAQFTEMTQRVK